MGQQRERPRRRRRARRSAPGSPPGTLAPPRGASPTRVVARKRGAAGFEERRVEHVADLPGFLEPTALHWIEVTGLEDAATIAAIGRVFGFDDLSLEDVLDPAQRPKLDHHEHYSFVVLRTLEMADAVEARHVSLFLGDRFVVTFQDVEHSTLEPVRQRLRHGQGKMSTRGADYLAYAILDALIDQYFPVIEAFDDHLEEVEDAVLEAATPDPIDLARHARADLQTIRHTVWPARDVVAALLREDVARITDETRVHLRDCYDHLVQVQEMVESSREIAASLLEAYLSRVSLMTNEVMKLLTVIATIFIPLTFIVGLYGMNFNPTRSPLNMPELNWYWGYPFSLLVMAASAAGALLYFRRKGWFGGMPSPPSAGAHTRSDGGR